MREADLYFGKGRTPALARLVESAGGQYPQERLSSMTLRDSVPPTDLAVFGVSAEQFRSYAPELVVLKEGKDLDAFLCRAYQRKRLPLVIVSGPARAEQEDGDLARGVRIWSRVLTSETYEHHGLEPMFDLRVHAFALDPRMCADHHGESSRDERR
jgi:hypothetical protein